MNKIQKNRKRDKKVQRALQAQGWTVMRFWEHELKSLGTKVLQKIVNISG